MNYLKKLGISFIYMFSIIAILSFITSILYYFNVIGSNTNSIIKIIIPFVAFLISGFIFGKKSKQKGWLEGIKMGLIFLIIIFLIDIIFLKYKIDLKNFIYYLILLISSSLGSMIGIQKKRN